MSNFVSKGQRSTFRRLSGCTYFLIGYLDTSWSVFPATLYTDFVIYSFTKWHIHINIGINGKTIFSSFY